MTNTPFDPSHLPSSPVQQTLEQLHRECAGDRGGAVATYIPELSKADPNWFGICLATTNGSVYEVGDSRQLFTIQSISKPFVYGMALEDCGREGVLQKVGVEPTGDVFNSISLEAGTGRPRNPMINAGAIATTGLVGGKPETRIKRILETFGKYTGRTVGLDESVYHSESSTGHRNRAIGHMLRNFDILTSDPMPVVELYFKQCSINVTCRDLALLAATLANQGVNPVTGERALRGEYVESVLSVMATCGMYDYAGAWMYRVGMPAKSGVSGGIIAVLPGQLGIGVFSPPLDAHGNSVRGIRVCEELSMRLDLHQLNRAGVGRSTIRLRFNGAEFSSRRVRSPEETRILRESGSRIRVWQLQGNLTFSTAEVLVRDVLAQSPETRAAIMDFKRVPSVNESASSLLCGLLVNFHAVGRTVVFATVDRVPLLRRVMKLKLGAEFDTLYRQFEDAEHALEWCEDQLFQKTTASAVEESEYPLSKFQLCEGLDAGELEVVRSRLTRHTFAAGETIIREGNEASEIYLLVKGRVSVLVPDPAGDGKRLASFQAGLLFGEIAVIDGALRSARIRADSAVECDRLSREDFDGLDQTHPGIKLKLWRNLARNLCDRLRKVTRELSVFD
jgi:glutaminase